MNTEFSELSNFEKIYKGTKHFQFLVLRKSVSVLMWLYPTDPNADSVPGIGAIIPCVSEFGLN